MILDSIKELVFDPEGELSSVDREPRLSESLLAAAALFAVGAGILPLYLRFTGFQGAQIALGTYGVVDASRAFLYRAYFWFAFVRLFVYPGIFHAIASLLGSETRMVSGLDAHARLTAASIVVFDVGTALTFQWRSPSLIWQAAFLCWGVAWHWKLGRIVYGQSSAQAAVALPAAVALSALFYAAILLTMA